MLSRFKPASIVKIGMLRKWVEIISLLGFKPSGVLWSSPTKLTLLPQRGSADQCVALQNKNIYTSSFQEKQQSPVSKCQERVVYN